MTRPVPPSSHAPKAHVAPLDPVPLYSTVVPDGRRTLTYRDGKLIRTATRTMLAQAHAAVERQQVYHRDGGFAFTLVRIFLFVPGHPRPYLLAGYAPLWWREDATSLINEAPDESDSAPTTAPDTVHLPKLSAEPNSDQRATAQLRP